MNPQIKSDVRMKNLIQIKVELGQARYIKRYYPKNISFDIGFEYEIYHIQTQFQNVFGVILPYVSRLAELLYDSIILFILISDLIRGCRTHAEMAIT